MITTQADLLDLLSTGLWHGGMVFFRVAAMVSLLPAFGERTVPVRVKLVTAIAFTAIVAPAVRTPEHPESFPAFASSIAVETLIGAALGMGLRLFVLALHTAGSIAAQATSLSQILGGAAAEPTPAMGYILVVSGLALAVVAGLHIRAAELMIYSYDLFKPGRIPDPAALAQWGVMRISRMFSLSFTVAAPFVIASLVYNLTLGAINRAMPQLMVAFVGAPVITFGGLALLLVGAPIILGVWIDALELFLLDPSGTD
ncbi:flagellar biosynthetic protein FliR [Primorskyibacter sp. S87]|uniref:flagellar biosynthetic protein FliR n=1 Tax=Primorskyibacter sp. S87 TaxID=3415126 RepID=UPI003C7A11FB